jgi:hypothetical protein
LQTPALACSLTCWCLWPLWVQRALHRWAGVLGWDGDTQGSRASREEDEALQFGLVFMESALAPGVERPRLAVALALACHRRPRWR